jgi:hypothetical protein
LLSTASATGTVMAPTVLGRHPLLIAALSPRSAFLLAAASRTPWPLFMAIGLARLSAAAPSHFSIGRTWGRSASQRLQRGPRPARTATRITEWLVRRLGVFALLASPTGKTVAVASAAELPAGRIGLALTTGALVRLLIFYVVAHH